MILPATAVDKRRNLKWAFRLSRGNGIRLIIAVVVPPILLSLPAKFLSDHSIFLDIVALPIELICLVIGIAALSASYRYLTQEAAPEQSPNTPPNVD